MNMRSFGKKGHNNPFFVLILSEKINDSTQGRVRAYCSALSFEMRSFLSSGFALISLLAFFQFAEHRP